MEDNETQAQAELKERVLALVYEEGGIKPVHGHQHLAAIHKRTNVGIVVVDGTFTREIYKQAMAEMKAAGANASRMYVYARLGTYSGRGICFCKFEEIGL